jgi:hypothetical protein
MTVQPLRQAGSGRRADVDRLSSAVREPFSEQVLVFPATDPVFGGGACRVGGCRRAARGHGLCQGHYLRWVKQGRPDLEVFTATTDPGWARQRPNGCCRVDGCGYGLARSGLCQLHWQRFARSGGGDLQVWLVEQPPVVAPPDGKSCRIEECPLWPQPQLPFCRAHAHTWKVHGRPDVEAFSAVFLPREATADETIRLDALDPRLRLEVQYALQCRARERTTKTLPPVVMRLVRFLTATTAASLLDLSEQQWLAELERRSPRKSHDVRSLLLYAHRKVDDLLTAAGWNGEYPVMYGNCAGSATPETNGWTSPVSPSRGCGSWSNDGCAGG